MRGKIVLAGINARYTHSCLALYSIKSYCRDSGYEFSIFECSINSDPVSAAAAINGMGPCAVGISTYIWNAGFVKRLIPLITGTKIILGGPEAGYNPRAWLDEFPGIDFIISGAGEKAFIKLLTSGLESDARIISEPNPRFSDLPFPYSDDDFAGLRGRYVYYESTRGCPYRCSYCLSSRTDVPFEKRDTGRVLEELDILIGQRPGTVKFVDRCFNADREHSRAVWRHIISRAPGTVFHFEVFPGILEDEDFDILSRSPAGLFRMEIGVQSVSGRTLAEIGRPMDWESSRAQIKRLVDMKNMHVHLDLIAGLPFEGIDEAAVSFDLVHGLRPDHIQLGFLKVLRGTGISLKTGDYGIVHSESPPYEVLETRWISRDDLDLLREVSRMVDYFYNEPGFSTSMGRLIKICGSPFGAYRALADRSLASGAGPRGRDWQFCAGFMLDLVKAISPDEAGYMSDCLRWDWCLYGRSHRYPPAVDWEGCREARRRGLDLFGRRGGDRVPAGRLRRSVFFSAETESFRRDFMNGHGSAVFIHGGGEPVFFD